MLIVDVLEELEYQVLEADGCEQALAFLHNDAQPIALMMTDVGLPVMDGRELAKQARAVRPQLPVLFASGYAESIDVPEGHVGDRQALLHRSVARQGQTHSFLSRIVFLVTIGAPRADGA